MQELSFLLIKFPCLKIMMEIVKPRKKLEQERFLFTWCWIDSMSQVWRDNTNRAL